MDKTQKLQKAKFYLEMLACSMDPTTQDFINSEILHKKEKGGAAKLRPFDENDGD